MAPISHPLSVRESVANRSLLQLSTAKFRKLQSSLRLYLAAAFLAVIFRAARNSSLRLHSCKLQ